MAKTNKPIEPLQEKESWQDYLDGQAWSLFPERDNWRKRLCHTLFLWGEKDEAYDLMQFCMRYKIKRSTLYKWRTQYEDIKDAVDEVKLMLACRRKIGALKRELDKDVVFKDLHRYDPEWDEVNKYHAELKRNENPENSGMQIVVVEKIASTGLVKPLPTKIEDVEPQISDHSI